MGAENFVNVSQAGKRSAKRARVLLAVKIRTCGAEIDARLRDLSQKGALIECSSPLAVDEEVVFSRGSTVVPARVAWAGAGKVGLEFKRMIDESEVLVQLGRVASSQPVQRFRRPRIIGEDLSEHERKLARVWGVAVGITVPEV